MFTENQTVHEADLSRTPRSAGTKSLCGENARLTSWSLQWAWLRLAMRLRLRLSRTPVLKMCSSRKAGSCGRLARSSLQQPGDLSIVGELQQQTWMKQASKEC